MATPSIIHAPAYRTGTLAVGLAIAAISIALVFEALGFAPCPLCLQQRWPYYIAIPVMFGALMLHARGSSRAAALLFFASSLGFIGSAGFGAYHAGVEWGFWPGPATCSSALQPLGSGQGGVLGNLSATQVARCDEPEIRVLGLSFAGWNVVASVMISLLALQAAFHAGDAASRQKV